MRIGFIPGALDTLSGEYFPHLVHMQENIAALEKRVEVNVLLADRANATYMRFQRSRFFKMLNRRRMHIIRKLLHFVFFIAVYMEVRKTLNHQQNDLFLVRLSFSNYLISRYLHSIGNKILLEVHALAHIEEKEYGQTYVPKFCSQLYLLTVTCLEKKILRLADQITTVSESLKNLLVNLGTHRGKIDSIHNAVDLDTFNYLTESQSIIEQYNLENKIVIGFVGSFARYHGIDILLDVAENLQKKYKNIRFLLVGKNVHGSDNAMEEVFTRRLSHIFTFAGEVPHATIPLYIAAMDIAIIPDFNTYGSPMKLFEYMAMKKAVVAPDVPPIREVIEDGQTGILFEGKNVAQAVKCIDELIENVQLRYDLGQKARAKVVRSYTWDQNAERIVKIAERMMGRP